MKWIKAKYIGYGEYEIKFWPISIRFGHAILHNQVVGGITIKLFGKVLYTNRLEKMRDNFLLKDLLTNE